MRVYPELRGPRTATLVRDAAFAVGLLVLGWLALWVRDAVNDLVVLGEGVQGAGGAISGGFEAAADAVDEAPVVGDDLADSLRDAGGATGGNVTDLGEEGEHAVRDLANVLGLLTFAVPAALLLIWYLPSRVAQVRRLTAAARVLAQPDDTERRRVVAMRAAFALPYGRLLAYTPDPLGDLAAERYDALLRAALAEEGLRPPPD
ncbi:MAG: hypothetical protein ICV59_06185 [Thermoleophilia bacterium]|nr:hypothetical protein [Thermoleophilia bacterium]